MKYPFEFEFDEGISIPDPVHDSGRSLSSVFTGKRFSRISRKRFMAGTKNGHIHGAYRDTICKYDNTRDREYTVREAV